MLENVMPNMSHALCRFVGKAECNSRSVLVLLFLAVELGCCKYLSLQISLQKNKNITSHSQDDNESPHTERRLNHSHDVVKGQEHLSAAKVAEQLIPCG